MNMPTLFPRYRESERSPAVGQDFQREPFFALQRDMNRLFEEVFRSYGTPWSGIEGTWPSVEIRDGERELRVVAEVPGMREEDVEILLDDDVLTLRGERKAESEDSDRRVSERFYGRFERRIPLGYEIDEDAVRADFDNGVLTVILPKREPGRTTPRRIEINRAA